MHIGFYLDLKDIFVALSFRRNLVSVSYLDKSVYFCSLGNTTFKLSFNSYIVGTTSLMDHDNLYFIGKIASCRKFLKAEARPYKPMKINWTLE